MRQNRSPEFGLYAGIIVGYAVGLTIAMAIVDHLQRRRDKISVQMATAERPIV